MFELVELKGTEKQIAWAEDIRKDMIESAKKIIKRNAEIILEKSDFNNRIAKKNILACEEIIKKIKCETEAKWYINNRKLEVSSYLLYIGYPMEDIKNIKISKKYIENLIEQF